MININLFNFNLISFFNLFLFIFFVIILSFSFLIFFFIIIMLLLILIILFILRIPKFHPFLFLFFLFLSTHLNKKLSSSNFFMIFISYKLYCFFSVIENYLKRSRFIIFHTHKIKLIERLFDILLICIEMTFIQI